MKYIDADKLIEGIKHIQSKFPVITYEALFHLIATLQQEQPEEDLKKEVDNYQSTHQVDFIGAIGSGYTIDFARHFFELGRINARKDE